MHVCYETPTKDMTSSSNPKLIRPKTKFGCLVVVWKIIFINVYRYLFISNLNNICLNRFMWIITFKRINIFKININIDIIVEYWQRIVLINVCTNILPCSINTCYSKILHLEMYWPYLIYSLYIEPCNRRK